jgi:DNA-binding CsgD family transcriptional regulator
LSADSATPWRDVVPIAVGMTGKGCRIEEVTTDINAVLGLTPQDCVGRSLLSLIHPDDVFLVYASGGEPPKSVMSRCDVRAVHRIHGWVDVCLLSAQLSNAQCDRTAFAMIGAPQHLTGTATSLIFELEGLLRTLGTDVRGAGVVDRAHLPPWVSDHPGLVELSNRQREILSLMLQGERVPAISATLCVSQSTVRNHLSVMFGKFGVHSQWELLHLLRPPPTLEPVP